MFRQGQENSYCFSEIKVSVDVFIIEFFNYGLFQLWTADVSEGEGEEDAAEGRSVLSVKGFDPFYCDGSDDCVEVVINNQVVLAYLVEDCSNLIGRKEFKVILYAWDSTLMSTARVLQEGALSICPSRR